MIAQFLRGEFVANVTKLLAGKAAVMGITLLTIPIISRLYSPSDFGVVGVFVAVCSIAVIFFTLKYESAVVLPESDAVAQSLSLGVVKLALAAALAFFVLVLIAKSVFSDQEIVVRLGGYIWLLPIVTLMMAIGQLFGSWLSRVKRFSRLAASEVALVSSNTGFRIVSGALFGSSVWALIIGLLAGHGAKIAIASVQAKKAVEGLTLSHVKEVSTLKSFSDFPRYTMPADFIRTFAQQLPMLLFGVMYSAAVAGLFYMAVRLIRAPVELALQGFRKVYLQKISSIKNANQPLRPVYVKSVVGMAIIGVLPALLFMFYGQELLTFLLGEEWQQAGEFAEILAPLLWSFWVSSPAAMMLVVLRKQNVWLYVQSTIAVAQLVMFAIAHVQGLPVTWALWGFVTIQIVVNLGMKLVVYVLTNESVAAAV